MSPHPYGRSFTPKAAEDIHQALAADDACAADSCGLGLLQARVLLHLRKRS